MEGGARPDGVRSLRRTQEGREGARNAATQQSGGRVPTDPAGVYRRRVGDGVPPVQAGDIAGAGRAVGYVGGPCRWRVHTRWRGTPALSEGILSAGHSGGHIWPAAGTPAVAGGSCSTAGLARRSRARLPSAGRLASQEVRQTMVE